MIREFVQLRSSQEEVGCISPNSCRANHRLRLSPGEGEGPADYLRQLLIIDEAHHVAPDKGNYKGFLDSMVMENRKYGQGVIVATTSPSQLSRWLMKNISIKVCHLLNDGEDIDLMLRFMVNEYEKGNFVSDFLLLGIGEAMVRISTPKQVPATKVKVSE
jgi:DNA helicase HerA-like ATPase